MALGERASAGRPATIAQPRQTILAAAARLFATQGFERTSLQDVARAVGLSKAAIYHYFPTKADIYDAIVSDLLEALSQRVAARLGQTDGHAEKLRLLMLEHADFFEEHYSAFVTLLHGVAGLGARPGQGQLAVRDRYETMVRQLIEDGQAAGDFVVRDAALTSRAVLSLLNWLSRWYRPEGPLRARAIAEEYYRIVTAGLLPR